MNQSLPTTMFPAARLFLLFWLHRVINTVAHQQNLIPLLPLSDEACFISQKSDLHTSKLPKKCSQTREQLVTKGSLLLTRVTEDTTTVYICPIAFKLSQSWETSPIDIATQIADRFSDLSSQELTDHPKKYFTLKVISPGWLHLQLTDLGIATWLQSLAAGQEGEGDEEARGRGDNSKNEAKTQILHQEAEPPFFVPRLNLGTRIWEVPPLGVQDLSKNLKLPQSLIFSIEYAHARCCSLLRLAQGEGKWGAIGPDAIPWLNEKGELRLTHPAERNLISQLLSALDALYCPESSKNLSWEKLAHQISLSWEKFYSQCRIWGEVKTETPELAQARLGLLMATQAMLRLLLEDCLGVPAPLEM